MLTYSVGIMVLGVDSSQVWVAKTRSTCLEVGHASVEVLASHKARQPLRALQCRLDDDEGGQRFVSYVLQPASQELNNTGTIRQHTTSSLHRHCSSPYLIATCKASVYQLSARHVSLDECKHDVACTWTACRRAWGSVMASPSDEAAE